MHFHTALKYSIMRFIYQDRLTLPHTLPKYLFSDSPNISKIRARFRFNRTTLNATIHRYNSTVSNYCLHCFQHTQIQHVEDVAHLLLSCPKYRLQRIILHLQLSTLNITLTLSTILGCVDHLSSNKQKFILQHTSKFIQSIASTRYI